MTDDDDLLTPEQRAYIDRVAALSFDKPAKKPNGEDVAPEHSEEAFALLFASRHAAALRYIAEWGKWVSWTGTYWKFDSTLRAFDMARKIAREAARKCKSDRTAAAIASGKCVGAIERLAKADRRLAATIEQWDADAWLLNTLLGVADLRTGKLRPHRPDDYMTKITAVGPSGDCPNFLAFLDKIMGGDEALISFLQRVFGYCLTGDTSEQAMFFNYGGGQNGKTVLMATIAESLAAIAARRQSRRLPRPRSTDTRPSLRVFTESDSSPLPRPRRAGTGRKAASRK